MEENKDLETAVKDLSIAVKNFVTAFTDSIKPVMDKIIKVGHNCIKSITTKNKISKKRFIKLLRSQGVDRDDINKIIKDNKEPYTITRLIEEIKRINERKSK